MTKYLADISNGDYTFRLGDEDNDLGHRGFAGISGWGWLGISDSQNGPYVRNSAGSDDFLFTVIVPAPLSGAMAFGGLAGVGVIRRRRLA